MENLILTSEQESSLILKGFTDLPQIKNEFISSEEIDHLIASKDKIYTSSTDFHKKYIDKNDIYTKLKKDLNEKDFYFIFNFCVCTSVISLVLLKSR